MEIRQMLSKANAVLDKMSGGGPPKPWKGPAPVEWQGEVVEAALGAGFQADRLRLADGKRRRNVWAVLAPGRTSSGAPKVEVHELLTVKRGSISGGPKLGQASVRPGGALDAAIRAGVHVGVVQLSADVVDTSGAGVEYSAALMLGRGYQYRPRAAWD
ncbi:hypothetical protein [Brachybacterium massiliense]|uniref:hypothetical protein n=1 Tax=Brachybacterium massiliense TaxID=1755098 RepID=UPI000B3BC011|nr:hypothetical protein [Brachybacterium massiliense]